MFVHIRSNIKYYTFLFVSMKLVLNHQQTFARSGGGGGGEVEMDVVNPSAFSKVLSSRHLFIYCH